MTHARGGIELCVAAQTGIDDHANALDRQAGFRNAGGEHDLALSRGHRGQGGILRRALQLPVQRQYAHPGIEARILEGALHAANLRGTGQETQDVAVVIAQGVADHLRRLLLEVDLRAPCNEVSRDVEAAAAGGNDRRVVQQPGDGLHIQSRRHHQEAQILAQILLTLDAQRQSQIGVQTALVKLIEDHATDVAQARVILQHAREDAFRDHFDARLAAHPRLEPSAKSNASADGFAKQLRHAAGDGARRDPPRFEHQDFSVPEPGTRPQEERHDGAFAGPWRRLQQHAAAARQGLGQSGKRLIDR